MSRKYKSDLLKPDINQKDMYDFSDFKKKISRKDYYNLLKNYYLNVRKAIVDDSYEYHFKGRWGGLSIFKYKPVSEIFPFTEDGKVNLKGKKVNWKATNKARAASADRKKIPVIYYDNTHTDYYKYGVWWHKQSLDNPEAMFMAFKACRDFNTQYGKAVLNGKDYFLRFPEYTK